eukprot:gene18887-biopygen5713
MAVCPCFDILRVRRDSRKLPNIAREYVQYVRTSFDVPDFPCVAEIGKDDAGWNILFRYFDDMVWLMVHELAIGVSVGQKRGHNPCGSPEYPILADPRRGT